VSWSTLSVSRDGTHHVRDDQPAYGERFDDVLPFQPPGVAAVRRGTEAWHIHPDARAAYRDRFVRTFGFYEGRAAVVATDGWHHILVHGLELTDARYAWCGNYQNGRCAVRAHDGRYFHITPGGARVYAETWKYVGDYRERYRRRAGGRRPLHARRRSRSAGPRTVVPRPRRLPQGLRPCA
jgi:hypothetical protein